MMKKIWKKWILVIVCLASTVFFASRASAAIDNAGIMKKWIFTQFYNCMRNYAENPLMQGSKGGLVVDDIFGKDTPMQALPSYGFQNNLSGGASCKDILVGKDGTKGVLDYAGWGGATVKWGDYSNTRTFLGSIGYEQQVGGGSGDTVFTVNAYDHYEITNNYTGTKSSDDRQVESNIVTVTKDDSGTVWYSKGSGGTSIKVELKDSNGKSKNKISSGTFSVGLTGCAVNNGQVELAVDADVQKFIGNLRNALSNITWTQTCFSNGQTTSHNYNKMTVDSGSVGDYMYDSNKLGGVIKQMSGMDISGLALNDSELYTLYVYYLNKFLPTNLDNRMTCNPSSTNNLTPVKLVDSDGVFKQCYINFTSSNMNTTVSTQKYDTRYREPYPTITTVTIQGIVDWLNSLDGSKLSGVSGIDTSYNQNTQSSDIGAECYSAGVEGQSWLLCPAIDNMASTMDSTDTIISKLLSIDSKLYDNDSVTKGVWETIRNFANVALIIVLLVIVFSQLTGRGIDNYGIKKMLPRLIVMAILINLSFVICQLAVDLSNILGVGLSGLFRSIPESLDVTTSTDFGQKMIAAVFAALGAAGAGASVGATVATVVLGGLGGPMIVISLVLVLLVAVIAVLFFFLSLGARMTIVIVFMAISPLAFACYILPNTQALFKKWWTIFKAALLVYPICGALYGLSFVIRGILFNTADMPFFQVLLAIFVPYLPYFLLPTLLKSSISAIGNIGGALANAGSGLRRSISNANQQIRQSEAYKTEAQRQKFNIDRWRAGYKARGRGGEKDRKTYDQMNWFEKVARGGKRGVASGTMAHASNIKTMGMIDIAAGDGGDTMISNAENAVLDERYKMDLSTYGRMTDDALISDTFSRDENGGIVAPSWYDASSPQSNQKMRALIATLGQRGKTSEIYSMLERTDVSGSKDVLNELKGTGDVILSAYGKAGYGVSFVDYMSGGKLGEDGKRTGPSIQSYAADKRNDFVGDKFDDKTAAFINKYENKEGVPRILSTDVLVHGMATKNAGDVLRNLNSIAENRDDFRMSGAQLTRMYEDSVDTIGKTPNGREALLKAYHGIRGNSDMVNQMRPGVQPKLEQMYTEAIAGGWRPSGNGSGIDVDGMSESSPIVGGGTPAAGGADSSELVVPRETAQPVVEQAQSQTQSVVQQRSVGQAMEIDTPISTQEYTNTRESYAPATGTAAVAEQSQPRPAINMQALGDETVLDIATNPNTGYDDATRIQAEREYYRRNPNFNSQRGSVGEAKPVVGNKNDVRQNIGGNDGADSVSE